MFYLQHVTAGHSYDSQLSGMSRSIAGLEETLRQTETERHQALQDLSAARDLCTRLEAAKDALQRQFTTRTLDHEKVC